MDLTSLNNRIKDLLATFDYRDLPNVPNISGIFEQTDIAFAIISGQRDANEDFIIVRINFSIAATLRTEQTQTQTDVCNYYISEEDSKNLYGIVNAVVKKLQKQKIPKGGLLKLVGFENFTPESGKWRSLLTFDVPIPIESNKDIQEDCMYILEEVN